MSGWNEDQEWERQWHGTCVNSYNEETKQLVYASRMGLKFYRNDKTPYNIDLEQKSVVDIGGGPYSLLLKCVNFKSATVIDPCSYPDWVYQRYDAAGIDVIPEAGENMKFMQTQDEIWIYNVLQHVMNPSKIVENALKYSKIIRLFEWVETGVAKGHPNNLTEKELNSWLGGYGKVEQLNENSCWGLCYYGIFKGQHYGE